MVTCDVTGGITLGNKPKMPIFTLYLPHNLQNRVLVSQKFIYLVDQKYNITYENIQGKLKVDRFLYPEMYKMAKKLPNNFHE